MNHEQMQAARRASSCRACRADGADIGAFDHGIPHTLADDCYAHGITCEQHVGRIGSCAFHEPREQRMPEWRRRALAGEQAGARDLTAQVRA